MAGRLEISPSYLSQIEHGLVPERAVLERLAAAAGENADEWVQAAGYETTPDDPPLIREASESYQARPSDAQLPLAGILKGGSMIHAEEEPGEVFPCLQEHAAQADYVVRIEGDSLYPLVLPGDYVAVRKTSSASPGDIVVARLGDETLVKRYVGRQSGKIMLESVNPVYPPIDAGEAEIIGVVVWQHRPKATFRSFGR